MSLKSVTYFEDTSVSLSLILFVLRYLQRSGQLRNNCETKFYQLLSSAPYFRGTDSLIFLLLVFSFPKLCLWSL